MFQDGHDAINSQDNPFWQYSLTQYKKPGCAPFLLAAQEEKNLDVNILLFIGWLAIQHKTLPSIQVLTPIQNWQTSIVRPIRRIRKRVKAFQHNGFYQHLKALELEAEKCEQTQLFKLAHGFRVTILSEVDCFKQSILSYANLGRGQREEDWLQALYQHLQP